MSRTPEQDVAVIHTLAKLREWVGKEAPWYDVQKPAGEDGPSVICNTSAAAIDYAIGVIKATQP